MQVTAPQAVLIPDDIEQRYVGQWIAWDTETSAVVGHGNTLAEAIESSAPADRLGHELYYHHVVPPDLVLVGGF